MEKTYNLKNCNAKININSNTNSNTNNTNNTNSNTRVDYEIPKKDDYIFFYKNKYTIPHLKFICKEFKLKNVLKNKIIK